MEGTEPMTYTNHKSIKAVQRIVLAAPVGSIFVVAGRNDIQRRDGQGDTGLAACESEADAKAAWKEMREWVGDAPAVYRRVDSGRGAEDVTDEVVGPY